MMDIINWQSYVECDIFEDKKTLQEQENESSELIENKAKAFIQKVLSLAREEGKRDGIAEEKLRQAFMGSDGKPRLSGGKPFTYDELESLTNQSKENENISS